MKKWIQLSALLLAVLMLAGCNLIATDPVLDAQQTVLEVGPDIVNKAELRGALEVALQENVSMYQSMGLPFDPQDPGILDAAVDQAVNELISQKVILQQGEALGLEEFTQEQLDELQPEVDSEWSYYSSQIQAQYFAETELEGDELTAAVDAKLVELGITKEEVLEGAKQRKISERVREQAIAEVTVSEEEIANEYNAKRDEQKQAYEADVTAYASNALNGADIYYVPAGYRYVKHVLIEVDAEAQQQIQTLTSELDALNTTKTNLESTLAGDAALATNEAATPAPLTEEEQAVKDDEDASLQAQLDETNASIAAKQAELDAVKNEAFAAVKPKVDEVKAKITTGLNFDKVIETYGEDTGMASEPFKTEGYPVMAGLTVYDAAFQDAAMALAQVGDVSEPVQSQFGYHIIKYIADSQEHEVGLDAMRDTISASLLTQKQEETYQAKLQEWIDATKVKRYNNRMNFE